MVGLVLVSHSATMAEGVAELAAQMGGGDLRIAVAGGLDRPGRPLGTDATLVMRAIDDVWSDDGVLVLMDLGSAVLSAEMAVDLLAEERRSRVVLTEAPFVEGAVAAAVAAGLGEPLEKVAEEARGGLSAKAAHLRPGTVGATAAAAAAPIARLTEASPPQSAAPSALRLTVVNRLGLHARPAALLVRAVSAFDADVTVANVTGDRGPVSARSLNAVATLGVRRDDEIIVRAAGPQAQEALAAVRRLAHEAFGEPDDIGAPGEPAPGPATTPQTGGEEPTRPAPTPSPPPAGAVLRGLPASPGIAVGAARRLRPAPIEIPAAHAVDPSVEWTALERALAATASDIRRSQRVVAGRAGAREAAIFDAHLLFLEDEALLQPARRRIFDQGATAARAWADAVSAAAAVWDAIDDPYQRARAADLRGVGDQVLRHLLGVPARLAPNGDGIVVAPDLSPAEAAVLDRCEVQGIACAFGGPTAHSAILARSLGIPAVVGLGAQLLGVEDGTLLALDGETGTVTVEPPPDAVAATNARRTRRAKQKVEAQERAHLPAVTRDGVAVHVAANIAGPQDVPAAVAAGADGVGLLRTEFLFLEADHMPAEGEQERAYREAAEALAGRPLTIRTLDAGADKPLPYLPLAPERNPFLGVRGLRLGLTHPDLLLGQLRAVLRVAATHPLRVLFPMVTTVDELLRARELLGEARASLAASGAAAPQHLEVGIMVEVPAAALTAEAFVPHVDFFSVGTNDLAQYALAAERGNPDVAALNDPLHPAVLRLIHLTVTAAVEGGKWVAVCGEVAGDPVAIPVLVGLGVTELSMVPAQIPLAKQAVRATDAAAARRLAGAALAAASAAEVRRLCGGLTTL
jgi:multiphosphoryl transfer protein